jgi:hypothetical protein
VARARNECRAFRCRASGALCQAAANALALDDWHALTGEYSTALQRKEGGASFASWVISVQTLRPADRVTLDEAREISRQAGQCLAYAKMLTEPESQAVGIGPTYAKSWTYEEAERVVAKSWQRAGVGKSRARAPASRATASLPLRNSMPRLPPS